MYFQGYDNLSNQDKGKMVGGAVGAGLTALTGIPVFYNLTSALGGHIGNQFDMNNGMTEEQILKRKASRQRAYLNAFQDINNSY